jgi:hypothetical protein
MKEDNPYASISRGIELLQEIQQKRNVELRYNFIKALNAINATDAVKEVENKGLPVAIIVSSDIYLACRTVFSIYAKVIENKLIDKENIMFLSWASLDLNLNKYNESK